MILLYYTLVKRRRVECRFEILSWISLLNLSWKSPPTNLNPNLLENSPRKDIEIT